MTRFSETQGGAITGADGDKRGPRVYFDVDDINAGNARVGELGGDVGRGVPGSDHGLVRGLQGLGGERVRSLADRSERARRVVTSIDFCGGEPTPSGTSRRDSRLRRAIRCVARPRREPR